MTDLTTEQRLADAITYLFRLQLGRFLYAEEEEDSEDALYRLVEIIEGPDVPTLDDTKAKPSVQQIFDRQNELSEYGMLDTENGDDPFVITLIKFLHPDHDQLAGAETESNE